VSRLRPKWSEENSKHRRSGAEEVYGDSYFLRIVIGDLLRNAWMSTSRRRANLEFGRAEQGGKATYLVNDEGSGFDARCSDWVFQLFQRYTPRLISR